MDTTEALFEHPLPDLSEDYRYRIMADLNTKLKILDKNKNTILIVDPVDLIFNDEFRDYSPNDILRIGFIFGQESMRAIASSLG